MAADESGPDEQGQAETFDETHMDDVGDGEVSLDTMEAVPDLTQEPQDVAVSAFDEVDPVMDQALADGEPVVTVEAKPGLEESLPAEQLGVADGDLDPDQAIQSTTTAELESENLSDADLRQLGYASDTKEEGQ